MSNENKTLFHPTPKLRFVDTMFLFVFCRKDSVTAPAKRAVSCYRYRAWTRWWAAGWSSTWPSRFRERSSLNCQPRPTTVPPRPLWFPSTMTTKRTQTPKRSLEAWRRRRPTATSHQTRRLRPRARSDCRPPPLVPRRRRLTGRQNPSPWPPPTAARTPSSGQSPPGPLSAGPCRRRRCPPLRPRRRPRRRRHRPSTRLPLNAIPCGALGDVRPILYIFILTSTHHAVKILCIRIIVLCIWYRTDGH